MLNYISLISNTDVGEPVCEVCTELGGGEGGSEVIVEGGGGEGGAGDKEGLGEREGMGESGYAVWGGERGREETETKLKRYYSLSVSYLELPPQCPGKHWSGPFSAVQTPPPGALQSTIWTPEERSVDMIIRGELVKKNSKCEQDSPSPRTCDGALPCLTWHLRYF